MRTAAFAIVCALLVFNLFGLGSSVTRKSYATMKYLQLFTPSSVFGRNKTMDAVMKHVTDVMKDAHRSPFRYGKRSGKDNLDRITFELARAAMNPKKFAPISEKMELELETEKQSILDLLPELRSHLAFVKLLAYQIIENRYRSMTRTTEPKQPVLPTPKTLKVSEMMRTRDTGRNSFETQKPLQHYRRMSFVRARPGKRGTSALLSPFGGTRQKSSLRYSPGSPMLRFRL